MPAQIANRDRLTHTEKKQLDWLLWQRGIIRSQISAIQHEINVLTARAASRRKTALKKQSLYAKRDWEAEDETGNHR